MLNSKDYLVKANNLLAVIATLAFASFGLAACGERAAPENDRRSASQEASGSDAAEATALPARSTQQNRY